MKTFKLMLAATVGIASIAVCNSANAATTITFEGLSDRAVVTNQYTAQGITFANATILQAPNYNVSNFPPHSGVNVIYNPAADIMLTFSSLVSNVSAYASTGNTLTLSAFNAAGTLLGTSTLAPTLSSNSLISFTGTGIASVRFSNGRSGSLTLDDVSFDAMPAVPEPATWAMMILGMGAVGFAMRRRQKGVTTTVAFA